MGTRNFAIENASNYFVVEDFEEEIDFDMWKEDIQFYLNDHGYESEDFIPQNDNRNFPSRVIASKTISKKIAENPIEVTIYAIVRSGYYAGACLDWSYQIETSSDRYLDEFPHKDWIVGEYLDIYEFSKGFGIIQSKNVLNFIDKALEDFKKDIETHFKNLTTQYNCIGVASNGEAFYEKVS